MILAVINVLTKKAATLSGLSFTLLFFALFILTERREPQTAAKSCG